MTPPNWSSARSRSPWVPDIDVHKRSMNATDLAAYNPNYVMGDIIGGANDGLQMVLRPRFGIDPYATGIDGGHGPPRPSGS